MRTHLCYKVMSHLPPLPDEYVQYALDTVASRKIPRTPDQHIPEQNPISEIFFKRNGETLMARANPRYSLEPFFNDWINDNITEEWNQIGVANSILFDESPN